MVNYQRSKIYLITSPNTNCVYVGTTTKLLCSRLGQHRADFKKFQQGIYKFNPCFEIMKHNDISISLIENFPCNTREELASRQRQIILQTEDCINLLFDEVVNNTPKVKCACGVNFYVSNRKRHRESMEHSKGIKIEKNWLNLQERIVKKDLERYSKNSN